MSCVLGTYDSRPRIVKHVSPQRSPRFRVLEVHPEHELEEPSARIEGDIIWWHQGNHGDRANQVRQDAWRMELNRFWTRYLFAVDNGMMNGPRAVVEREDRTWVEYKDWPMPGAAPVVLSLADGVPGLKTRPTSQDVRRPGLQTRRPEQSFADNSAVDADTLAAASESPHRLLYQTAPRAAPVHVSGIPDRAGPRLHRGVRVCSLTTTVSFPRDHGWR